jgi:hypothetical protein
MDTKRFWNPLVAERRSVPRRRVDLYAVELVGSARYLRKIRNVSDGGLMLEDRLLFQHPGRTMELELPRHGDHPLRVRAKVVRVTPAGEIGLRTIGDPGMLDGVGGHIEL